MGKEAKKDEDFGDNTILKGFIWGNNENECEYHYDNKVDLTLGLHIMDTGYFVAIQFKRNEVDFVQLIKKVLGVYTVLVNKN